MNVLLDTHALLWYINNDRQLSKAATEVINSVESNSYVSVVSLWEITVKKTIGKLELKPSLTELMAYFDSVDFKLLPIEVQHLNVLSSMILYHRDPFDRMLIAQAITEGFVIVTRDTHFTAYGVKTIW